MTHPALDPADFRFAVPAPAIAGADAGAPRTFSGLAYSGEPVTNHGPWSALVLDLEGAELPPVLPVLLGHERNRRVGICTLTVRDGALWADGRLLANPDAQALAGDADAGFPWQLSVHAEPTRVEAVPAGQSVRVNGRELTGPASVFRGVRIRELSFTPTGADHRTGATVLHTLDPDEDPPMPPESVTLDALTAQVAALSARAEAAEAALAAAAPAPLIADLQGQVAALSAQLARRTREDLLTAALADGRLIAGTPLHTHAEGLDLEPLRDLLTSLTPIAALGATQTAGAPPAGADFSAALAAEFGDEEAYRAYQRAQAAGRIKRGSTLTTED